MWYYDILVYSPADALLWFRFVTDIFGRTFDSLMNHPYWRVFLLLALFMCVVAVFQTLVKSRR